MWVAQCAVIEDLRLHVVLHKHQEERSHQSQRSGRPTVRAAVLGRIQDGSTAVHQCVQNQAAIGCSLACIMLVAVNEAQAHPSCLSVLPPSVAPRTPARVVGAGGTQILAAQGPYLQVRPLHLLDCNLLPSLCVPGKHHSPK